MTGHGLDLSDLGGQVAASFEHDDDPSGSIKCG